MFNGTPYGFFCNCDVRHGDPLSPFLFCIAEDVLQRYYHSYGFAESFQPQSREVVLLYRMCYMPMMSLFFVEETQARFVIWPNLLKNVGLPQNRLLIKIKVVFSWEKSYYLARTGLLWSLAFERALYLSIIWEFLSFVASLDGNISKLWLTILGLTFQAAR